MRLTRLYGFLLVILLTSSTQFASAAAGLSCEQVFTDNRAQKIIWNAQADVEKKQLGRIGIPGGVDRGRVHNQVNAENCWAQAITTYLESWYFGKTGKKIRLSPERVMVTFLYSSFHANLGKLERLDKQLDAETPAQRRKTIAALGELYSEDGLNLLNDKTFMEKLNSVRRLLFEPDVGTDELTSVEIVPRFGLVPDSAVEGTIYSPTKEHALERNLYKLWGKLLHEVRISKNPSAVIEKYRRRDPNNANDELYKFLRNGLNRDLSPAAFMRPDEKFIYAGKEYTPRSFYQSHFLDLDFDLHDSLVPVQVTKTTFTDSMNAMALGLLKTNLPVPFGMMIFSDKISTPEDRADTQLFAEATGLFSSKQCEGGVCQIADGGHEVNAVNFTYTAKSGRTYQKHELENGILNGDITITSVIFQNSWGTGTGTDVNGQRIPNATNRGYYMVTAEYLRQALTARVSQTYDFMLPRDVVLSFPSLKKLARGHWKQ